MIDILCTLGPASLEPYIIEVISLLGIETFRLNLSHIELEKVEPTIKHIRKYSSVDICLDTEGTIGANPLTDKDCKALEIGKDMGIETIALSFTRHASNIDEVRERCIPNSSVIAKIECLDGINNLRDIAKKADALLIDRGDLSKEIPLERIPRAQKNIIEIGHSCNTTVYVATNLIESMITQPKPTLAEVNDVFNTLLDGADGLVLAGETAIGQYPIGCVAMIKKIIKEFENEA